LPPGGKRFGKWTYLPPRFGGFLPSFGHIGWSEPHPLFFRGLFPGRKTPSKEDPMDQVQRDAANQAAQLGIMLAQAEVELADLARTRVRAALCGVAGLLVGLFLGLIV
jgi:hypothetical protein